MRMIDSPTIEEAYPAVGIIESIHGGKYLPAQDWAANITLDQAQALDDMIRDKYYSRRLNRTGQRITTSDGMERVCRREVLAHGEEWNRLWIDYRTEYNPVWNVDGTETITEEHNLQRGYTGNESTTASGTDSDKHTGTGSTQSSGTDSTDRSGTDKRTTNEQTFGFDSGAGVPTRSTSEDLTAGIGEDTTYGKRDTETRDFTDATTYGRKDTHERDLVDTDTGTITTTHKRGGNIGVTMTQQMLTADRDYWTAALSRVFEVIVADIVSDITYSIY